MAHQAWQIHSAKIGTNVLPHVAGQAIEMQIEEELAANAGDLFPRQRYVWRAGLSAELRSHAIYTILGKLDLDDLTPGMDLATAANNLLLTVGQRKYRAEGFETTAISYLLDRGYGYLRSLSADERGICSLVLDAISTSANGTVAGYTRSAVASLQTLPTAAELYRVSSIVVGSQNLAHWSGFDWSCEANVQAIAEPKDLYATQVMVAPDGLIEHTLTIQSEELTKVFAETSALGKEVTTVITMQSLSKAGVLGGAVAQVTLTHRGTMAPSSPRGDAQGRATDTFTSRGRIDGTTYPTTIALT